MARLSRWLTGAGESPCALWLRLIGAAFVVVVATLGASPVLAASPIVATEQCTNFNTSNVAAKQSGGSWTVAAGATALLNCGTSQSNADTAVGVIKNYGMNSKCSSGGVTYWLASGKAPSGVFNGETAKPFDDSKLNVVQAASKWWIVAGKNAVIGFATQDSANAFLTIIRKYGFNSFCYAGTLPNAITYFKKVLVMSTKSISIGPISIPSPGDVLNSLTGGAVSLPGGVSLPWPPGVPVPPGLSGTPGLIPLPPGVPVPPGLPGSTGSTGHVTLPGGVNVPTPPGIPVPPGLPGSTGSSGHVTLPGGVNVPTPPGIPLPPGIPVPPGLPGSTGSNVHGAVPVGSTGSHVGTPVVGIPVGVGSPVTGHPVTGSSGYGPPTVGTIVGGATTPVYTPPTPLPGGPGTPQPPKPTQMNCVSFNPGTVQAKQINGTWKVVDGDHWMLDFGANGQANAQMAVNIIKHYNFNTHCMMPGNTSFGYWLASGTAPQGPYSGEDRIGFNLSAMQVQQISGDWKIVDTSNNGWLFDFKTQADAYNALSILKQYGFTSVCYVGRPNPPMIYLRKDIPLMVAPPSYSNPPTGGTPPSTGTGVAAGGIHPILPTPIHLPTSPIVHPPIVIHPPIGVTQPSGTTDTTGATGTTDTGTTGTTTGAAAPPAGPHPIRPGLRPGGSVIKPPIVIRPPLSITPSGTAAQPSGTTGTTGATGTTGSTGTPTVVVPPSGLHLPGTLTPGTTPPVVYTPPTLPPGFPVAVNPANVQVQRVNGMWAVVDGSKIVATFGINSGKQQATQAVDLIKHYGVNSRGYVESMSAFQYWLVNGQAPAGALSGEDAIAFNPSNLSVKQNGTIWQILEGTSHAMFAFKSQANAQAALGIIQKYGFTHSCFVGRGVSGVTPLNYFRK